MNAKSLIGGILAGAAIGVAIGMLFAPDSGSRTQKKLVKGARKLGDSLKQSAGDSFQSLKNKVSSKAREEGNAYSEQARTNG
jgi:gas vesicle protein